METQEAEDVFDVLRRLEAAEACARALRDHLTGDGGFGGKPTKLDCVGCAQTVEAWEKARGG